MGDSITYGVGDEANGGYRVPLLSQFPKFVSRGHQVLPDLPEAYLHHDGYPGEKSTFILSHVDASLASWFDETQIKPDVVLLHIGTNDSHDGGAPDPALTPAQSRDNTLAIVNQLLTRRPNAHIFVMPPINAGSDATNAALNAWLNSQRPLVIAALTGLSPRCHLVGTPTIPDGDFVGGSTGLHPTSAGYALMVDDGAGKGWKPALTGAGF